MGTAMSGPITRFLSDDHDRLDDLLLRAVERPDRIELGSYGEFRGGLLRHIALEEKVLLPAARAARGEPLPEARRLRVDHGAIAALLVGPPTHDLVRELRSILGPHNELEEAGGGVYATCDALLASDAERLVERMRAYPTVKVNAYQDNPKVCRTAADALRISGLQAEKRGS